MNTYWLSFAGEKFRGVVITDADNEEAALKKVDGQGLNPGGEVMIINMTSPDGLAEAARWGRDRLIKCSELEECGYRRMSQLDPATRSAIEARAGKDYRLVCKDCNQ